MRAAANNRGTFRTRVERLARAYIGFALANPQLFTLILGPWHDERTYPRAAGDEAAEPVLALAAEVAGPEASALCLPGVVVAGARLHRTPPGTPIPFQPRPRSRLSVRPRRPPRRRGVCRRSQHRGPRTIVAVVSKSASPVPQMHRRSLACVTTFAPRSIRQPKTNPPSWCAARSGWPKGSCPAARGTAGHSRPVTKLPDNSGSKVIEKLPNPGAEFELHAYITNVYVRPEARSTRRWQPTPGSSVSVLPRTARRFRHPLADTPEPHALRPPRLRGPR